MFRKIKQRINKFSTNVYNKKKAAGKVKYFCIGRNKTGTTSLERAFRDLGYPVGDQRKAEVITGKHYFDGNFDPIVKYCKTAQVFQDVPFSYPDTYKHLDQAYPGSKFILTVRDNSEQWYNSITRFHAKNFGKGGRIPTAQDLKESQYVWPGFMYNVIRVHGTTDEEPYNKDIMINHYEKHNQEVIEYFKDRQEDLLIINVAEEDAYQKFVTFLGIVSCEKNFPWENRT